MLISSLSSYGYPIDMIFSLMDLDDGSTESQVLV